MEDTLQRVFAIILSVVVFFLLPLYMAFEKKDDIAYSMALRITSNFVDNVTNKGYITEKMYTDFISDLALTGNDYEVKMQHKAKKYYPVVYAKVDGNQTEYDYNSYRNLLGEKIYDLYEKDGVAEGLFGGKPIVYGKGTNNTLTLNYKTTEILYTEKQILGTVCGTLAVVGQIYKDETGNIIYYPMSKGDEFTVVIKNTNTTIASILFNTLTAGNNTDNSKVYINYGGVIQNESYRTNKLTGESTNVYDTYITEDDELIGVECSVVLKEKHTVGTKYGDVNLDLAIDNLDVDEINKIINNEDGIENLEQKKINSMITNDTIINDDDKTALEKYISGDRDYLIKRKINTSKDFECYLVFDNGVNLKSGITNNDAISAIAKDISSNNKTDVIIKSLVPTKIDKKVWKLVLEMPKNECLYEIRIKSNNFIATSDKIRLNKQSENLKIHFVK